LAVFTMANKGYEAARWHPNRASMLVVLAAVAAALWIPAPAAAASVLYVDNGAASNCSDSGTGTASQPYCSIVKAAKVARAGDVIEVRSGTYAGKVVFGTSGTSGAPIVLRSAPGAVVTITSGSYGIGISSRSWITVEGVRVQDTTAYGISVSGSSKIVLRGLDVSNAGERVSGETALGIRLSGCSSCLLEGSVVHDNSDHGIGVSGGTTGTVLIGNETFGNARGFARAAAGINVTDSTGNVVEANVSHHNEDSGIQLKTGGNDNLVVNNRSYANGDHGFDTVAATGARYISNVSYRNTNDGLSIESSSTGATVWNNISVDNGLATNGSDLWVSANSQPGFASDYNVLWNSTGPRPIKWGTTRYASVTAFHGATGNEAHGIGADPMFVAPGAGDFHLVAGSPAIDSADSGIGGQRQTDAEGNPRVDDLFTPNQGAGPRPYDDRGALEYLGGVLLG
jgi:parallel beta-helix repeat protein